MFEDFSRPVHDPPEQPQPVGFAFASSFPDAEFQTFPDYKGRARSPSAPPLQVSSFILQPWLSLPLSKVGPARRSCERIELVVGLGCERPVGDIFYCISGPVPFASVATFACGFFHRISAFLRVETQRRRGGPHPPSASSRPPAAYRLLPHGTRMPRRSLASRSNRLVPASIHTRCGIKKTGGRARAHPFFGVNPQ